jgi:hypothetical protein
MKSILFLITLFTVTNLSAQTVANQAPIRLETPHNWSKNKTMDKTVAFTAPAGKYIVSAQQRIHSKNGPGSSGITTSQPNSSLISLEEARSSFEQERSFVFNLSVSDAIKAELNAAIDQRQEAYEKRYFELASSHATVIHTVSVRGQGVASFKGRSWYEGSVTVVLLASAPEFENVQAFKQKNTKDFKTMLDKKHIKVNHQTILKPVTIQKKITSMPLGAVKIKKNN